ncbi:tyrosine protein kinase, partial [Pseudoxanthomonas sp. SGD-10]
MKKNNIPAISPEDESEVDLKQVFEQYAFYWRWFVLSIVVFVLAAFIYLRYAQEIYNVSAKILLQNESEATGELAGLAELSSLAGAGSPTSAFVSDQIDVLKSRRILRKVVEEHHLNITYQNTGKIKSSEVLEKDAAVKLVLLGDGGKLQDSAHYRFKVFWNDENSFDFE